MRILPIAEPYKATNFYRTNFFGVTFCPRSVLCLLHCKIIKIQLIVNYVDFKGLKHYPIGNTNLQMEGENLNISNFQNCSDGLMVYAPEISDWKATTNDIEIVDGVSLTSTMLAKDGYGRIKVIGQQAIYFDPETGQAKIAYNSKLLAPTFSFIGEFQGEEVFNVEFENPNCDPNTNWILVAVAVGALIVSAFDYKKVTTVENGEVTKTETTVSFGGAGIVNPGGGGGGGEHEIDHAYIRSEMNYPDGLPLIKENKLDNIQLAACGIDQLTLTDEKYS